MSDSPIRLLVVVNVYRPDLGGGVLFADLCEGLAERGLDVTVKCAYSYYPEWKDKTGENGWAIRSTQEFGVRLERHGIYIPNRPTSLTQRLLYEASFYLSLRRRLPERGVYDAVLVFCPLVGSVAYACAAARRLRAPLWLNVQDLSAQAAAAGGFTGSRGVGRLLVGIQNRLFRRAGYWSSISEPMVSLLRKAAGPEQDISLIPNWMHRSLGEAISKALNERPASAEETNRTTGDTVRLLYSGNIGAKQNLVGLCRYLSSTAMDFSFRIQAEGGGLAELRAFLDKAADPRFELRDLTDEKGLARALVATDFYVITERRGVGTAFIPSKLIPGITAETPILAVCDPDSPLGMEVTNYDLGPRIDWANLSALESAVPAGARRDPEYSRWVSNARSRSAYFTRETGIARCEAQLRRMVSTEKGKSSGEHEETTSQ